MQHLTFAIYSSNIDHIKGYNTLSYLKLHVEFEYCNRLEPNPTWDAVLQICDFAIRLLRSKNEKSILSHANFRSLSSSNIEQVLSCTDCYMYYI